MRLGPVALLVAALSARAVAEPRELGVVVQGDAKLTADVKKAAHEAGFTPVTEPLSHDGLETLTNCFIIEDMTCARSVVEARSTTPRLVFVRTDDATAIVTWFSTGHTPLVEKGDCAACAVDKLARSASEPNVSAEDVVVRPRKHSRTVPALMIGAGAATLITGGALLYYGLRDGASHKYVYPQLTPVGITLLAVGGGAVIGGMITW